MLNFYSKQLLMGGKSIPVKEVDFIFDASYGPFISGTDIDLNEGTFTIKIKNSVYEGAYYRQIGGYRNHIMHEMCHVML